MKRLLLISMLLAAASAASAQEIHEVTPLDLGPLAEDYAPVFLDSGLVICSLRESEATIAFKNAETGKPLADLYWVPMEDDVPGRPFLFSSNLATPVNDGPATFTDGGRSICFTRNQVLPKKLSNFNGNNSHLGLYFSSRTNETWSAPTAFEHNSTKYSAMHPALSAHGDTLIFASDMPGGVGKVDLYRSVRGSNGWTIPVNLGPMINGPDNDVFPAFGQDGTLYFSSDRVGGQGKLDIYVVHIDGDHFLPPQALEAPINSPGNDLGMAMRPDGRSGWFSTDRTGIDRIFSFKRTVPKFRECAPQQLNNYCYSLKTRPHAATVTLPLDHVWDLGDGTRITGTIANHCYKDPGTFTVRSLLIDRRSGSVFQELKRHDFVIEDIRQAWISAPDTVRTGRALILDAKQSHLPDMQAGEFHWDMGDGSLLYGNRTQHTFRAPGVYEVKLDILSVPDADGHIANRCNTRKIVVLDRFRDHEDMAVVATYQDAAGNNHSFEYQELPFDQMGVTMDELGDATFSVELFASKDRISLDDPKFAEVRKLYRVVERFDPERGVYTYSVGETKDMEELYKVFRKVKELQFLDAEVHQLQMEKLMDLSQLDMASLQELNHTKLRTNAIHFAYKSADLGEGSEVILEQVTGLMRQHPELKLVIEAHTDDIGSRAYNLDLSQQRALSVLQYMEAHGITGDRLVPIGHGKNQPIASNKTEEGRSKNRRVEFRMTVNADAEAFQKQGALTGVSKTPTR
ncbi:MAG: OmpA family protein [Flavobacteriales bacterium]|nr:OmpA family protein [Flavobacteriales bacterium]